MHYHRQSLVKFIELADDAVLFFYPSGEDI